MKRIHDLRIIQRGVFMSALKPGSERNASESASAPLSNESRYGYRDRNAVLIEELRPTTPCMNIDRNKNGRDGKRRSDSGERDFVRTVDSRAPDGDSCPFRKWRTMFSSIMMASSTTIPIAKLKPSRA